MKKIEKPFKSKFFKVKKYKKLLFFTLLFWISVCVLGCDEEESLAPIELTLVSGWGGSFDFHKEMRAIYEEFDRQNPDITLKFVPYSDNAVAVKKAIDMLAVGNPPDIVSTNGFSKYLEYAVQSDEVMDLMPYVKDDKELYSQIHPEVFETWESSDGKLYTIPDALEISGIWYNEEYLRQAGITDTNGTVLLPKTWDGFMDMLPGLQTWIDRNHMNLSVFSLEEDQMEGSYFLARLAGENEEGRNAAVSEEPVLSADLLEAVLLSMEELKQYSAEANNIEDARQKFLDGKTVFYFGGVWESAEFIKSPYKENIRYANYPTNSGESLGYLSASSGYVIAKQDSERKAEACIRFLKYMLSKEVQERIVLKTSQAPVNTSISLHDIKNENLLLGESLEIADSADIQISTIYSSWKESQIETIRTMIENK